MNTNEFKAVIAAMKNTKTKTLVIPTDEQVIDIIDHCNLHKLDITLNKIFNDFYKNTCIDIRFGLHGWGIFGNWDAGFYKIKSASNHYNKISEIITKDINVEGLQSYKHIRKYYKSNDELNAEVDGFIGIIDDLEGQEMKDWLLSETITILDFLKIEYDLTPLQTKELRRNFNSLIKSLLKINSTPI